MQSMNVQKSNENTLSIWFSNDFIDLGWLHVAHTAKYLTFLLTLRYVLKVDNLHMTQCAKISWIHGKCRQRFFIYFSDVFNVFLNFYLKAYYIYDTVDERLRPQRRRDEYFSRKFSH